ncbi:Gfo/Idh/MocA family oxidoreductase [soil metagenome]
MNSKKLGIGIVGCGNISDTHADAISALDSCDLVAACTRNPERLDSFCDKYSITPYPSYDEFLTDPGLDIVTICTPSGTHLDYGKKAANAGKHVIVEKPIEVTLERGKKLVETCRKNKVKLAVIYQNRFIDSVVKMKKILDEGGIGKVFMASAAVKWFRDQNYYNKSGWRGTFSLDGGGAVINQSIHTIDLLQWMLGDMESIFAYTTNSTHDGIEAEDNSVAAMQFSNGPIGVFQASTSIVPPQERTIEINGVSGTLLLEGNVLSLKTDLKEIDSKKAQSKSAGASDPLDGLSYKDHFKQYEQIINAITTNGNPVVSGEESLKSLAVVEAIYQSAKKRKPVSIDSILPKSLKI